MGSPSRVQGLSAMSPHTLPESDLQSSLGCDHCCLKVVCVFPSLGAEFGLHRTEALPPHFWVLLTLGQSSAPTLNLGQWEGKPEEGKLPSAELFPHLPGRAHGGQKVWKTVPSPCKCSGGDPVVPSRVVMRLSPVPGKAHCWACESL